LFLANANGTFFGMSESLEDQQGAEVATTSHTTQPISPKIHIPNIPNSNIPNAKKEEHKPHKSSRPREPDRNERDPTRPIS
jgi:hypothetical protein